jgi:carbon storage regulator
VFGVQAVRQRNSLTKEGEIMLVLSRKPGEKILIGPDVTVTVVRIGPNTVRIGIDAPRGINIVREELYVPADDPNTAIDEKPKPACASVRAGDQPND